MQNAYYHFNSKCGLMDGFPLFFGFACPTHLVDGEKDTQNNKTYRGGPGGHGNGFDGRLSSASLRPQNLSPGVFLR